MKALLILFSLILVTDAFSSYTGPNPNFNSVSIETSLKGDEITTPSTPPANVWKLYFKTSGLYVMDDVGNEYNLLTGGGAGIPTMPKGALFTSDGADNGYHAAGLNGQSLVYDSAQSDGLKGSYCTTGEIKSFHTFNGTLPLPRGFMKLNGDVVNSTNYDAIHGAGAYTADGMASSALAGKNLPNSEGGYLTGASSTTQDGSGAITNVGDADNTISLAHSHTVNAHNHTWWDYVSGGDDNTYNSSGSTVGAETLISKAGGTGDIGIALVDKMYADGSAVLAENTGIYYADANMYTSNDSPGTNSQLSATQTIRPNSVEVIHIICVR